MTISVKYFGCSQTLMMQKSRLQFQNRKSSARIQPIPFSQKFIKICPPYLFFSFLLYLQSLESRKEKFHKFLRDLKRRHILKGTHRLREKRFNFNRKCIKVRSHQKLKKYILHEFT